jgi:hypothetical protein
MFNCKTHPLRWKFQFEITRFSRNSKARTTENRVARWYAYFETKNHTLGEFCRALQWKMMVHFMAIWYILWPFGVFFGHLVYFSLFGICIFPVLVCFTNKNLATPTKKKKLKRSVHAGCGKNGMVCLHLWSLKTPQKGGFMCKKEFTGFLCVSAAQELRKTSWGSCSTTDRSHLIKQ